jgi:hypothetical protein
LCRWRKGLHLIFARADARPKPYYGYHFGKI